MGGGGVGDGVSVVNEALARHAAPLAGAGRDTFGGGATPEEDVLFFSEGRIGMFATVVGVGVIVRFVQVVPGGRVENVVEGVGFGLGEDGVQLVRAFVRGGGDIKPVEVGQVGLVTDVGGQGPVGEEGAKGMRSGAGGAERAHVPDALGAGGGVWGAANAAEGVE